MKCIEKGYAKISGGDTNVFYLVVVVVVGKGVTKD